MQNLLDNLKNLLQKDERLVSEGELLKNKIIELAIKLDKDLIELLLSDKQMKEVFFTQVGKATIFDKDKFIRFVSNKQFLPDSYTAFKNKIGLTEDDEFIKEKKDVVLSWPYKDCVLEGGMTKEDQKRDEIFWNETLAPDEISRLLDPKVFANAKRIDAKGEHKFDKFKTDENSNIRDNLIIKGNNLLVLHSLKKRFAGKVKLIYIDPPYNRKGDTFYNDSFKHSSWLAFMKSRLEVARDLLAPEGVILISINDEELAYLKVLCDEIYKRENYLNTIVWYYSAMSSYPDKKLRNASEYILAYAKNNNSFNGFSRDIKDIKLKFKNIAKVVTKISQKIDKDPKEIFLKIGIYWDPEKSDFYMPYQQSKSVTVKDYFLAPYDDVIYSPAVNRNALERRHGFTGQKPESLLHKIIEMTTNKNDLVLDFFVGTGTTCAVAHKMNRRYIGIEQLDYGKNDSIVRLKNVVNGDRSGISKSVNWKGGGDFVYLELMKWNENFVEKIQKAKTKGELKELWETMKKKAFLSYKIDIKAIDEKAKDFADLSIDDQKRFLLECLDKNHLYINYSEIDDEEYGISKEDKKLNKEFYGNNN